MKYAYRQLLYVAWLVCYGWTTVGGRRLYQSNDADAASGNQNLLVESDYTSLRESLPSDIHLETADGSWSKEGVSDAWLRRDVDLELEGSGGDYSGATTDDEDLYRRRQGSRKWTLDWMRPENHEKIDWPDFRESFIHHTWTPRVAKQHRQTEVMNELPSASARNHGGPHRRKKQYRKTGKKHHYNKRQRKKWRRPHVQQSSGTDISEEIDHQQILPHHHSAKWPVSETGAGVGGSGPWPGGGRREGDHLWKLQPNPHKGRSTRPHHRRPTATKPSTPSRARPDTTASGASTTATPPAISTSPSSLTGVTAHPPPPPPTQGRHFEYHRVTEAQSVAASNHRQEAFVAVSMVALPGSRSRNHTQQSRHQPPQEVTPSSVPVSRRPNYHTTTPPPPTLVPASIPPTTPAEVGESASLPLRRRLRHHGKTHARKGRRDEWPIWQIPQDVVNGADVTQ